MNWDEIFNKVWQHHRGKVIGIGLGLLFGLLAVSVGLWKTLFIAICIGIGYLVGKRADEKGDLQKLLNKWFGD
ncbi:MAG TPA: DUF2273 domain-containing protein [Clostridia bacterium]|nr:DUF2273 domain-containing protein [Clostridia bacterium]